MIERRRRRRTASAHPPRRGTSTAARTRDELLIAGRRLFAARGYDGASVRAITREARANLGAVTYHFGSKRGLYAAVLEQGLRPLVERVHAVASSEGTGLDRMLGVVTAYFDHLAENPDLPRLLLQEIAAGKQPPHVVVESVRSLKAAIAKLQVEGEADGSIRPSDPDLTALSVVSQPIYLMLVAPLLRTLAPIDLARPAMRQRAVEHTLAFVRAGLAAKGRSR